MNSNAEIEDETAKHMQLAAMRVIIVFKGISFIGLQLAQVHNE